ncbi:hypothetical protein ASPZODRAFT_135262 [Penicilliopsis zonata CBS 506.65]|uniref:Sulfotransferase domain-containing protein n=1 Tax=Penicilliopsis zonata CBS 506.65 TaxID=1073090 RepID=A0A1L9SBE8_9EURO|nr:hypothetical protein ASPZODRAFT_135262 [Penicilliopsis zonata CBS 506.65]OJJ44439.1 hypothetical protein ASPZODRAFT_135262 [Penicilliopsis zonata CBS 506.65]
MREVRKSGHTQAWIDLLKAKEEGKVPTRGDFDAFLGEYSCLSDIPVAIFAAELIAAYPAAKVILSTRDEEGWMKSMHQTIWHHRSTGAERAVDGSVPNERSSVIDLCHEQLWRNNFEAYGRDCFRSHNREVARLMESRPGDFLIYDVRQGWEPLCAFLGKEVPVDGFPHRDDWSDYKGKQMSSI